MMALGVSFSALARWLSLALREGSTATWIVSVFAMAARYQNISECVKRKMQACAKFGDILY